MTRIDGRAIAAVIGAAARAELDALAADGVAPRLAALVASDDPASAWYVRSLERAAAESGVGFEEVRVDAGATAVCATLDALSARRDVHGLICLTPLPAGLDLARAGEHIAAAKDVDGANPTSLGRLAAGLPAFAPATAQAVLEILRAHGVALDGASATVVGRSNVVGKPLALLLLAANATVTVCHSHTRDLAAVTRRADVLVAAAGRPGLIGAEHVAEGAVVVDVGTSVAADGTLVGDVDADAVEARAAALTPVPGGVGPVTTAVLLANVVRAARALS